MLFIMKGKSELHPDYNIKNYFQRVIVFGLMALDFNLLSEPYSRWIALLIIAYLIYLTYKDDFFKNWRVVSYSVIPYLSLKILSILINFLFPDFYKSNNTITTTPISFSILWIVGMAILHNR
jgi:hypothetical protein